MAGGSIGPSRFSDGTQLAPFGPRLVEGGQKSIWHIGHLNRSFPRPESHARRSLVWAAGGHAARRQGVLDVLHLDLG